MKKTGIIRRVLFLIAGIYAMTAMTIIRSSSAFFTFLSKGDKSKTPVKPVERSVPELVRVFDCSELFDTDKKSSAHNDFISFFTNSNKPGFAMKSGNLVPVNSIRSEVDNFLPKDYRESARRLSVKIIEEINSLNPSDTNLNGYNFDTQLPNVKSIRKNAEIWPAIADVMYGLNDQETAITLCLGTFVLADKLERRYDISSGVLYRVLGCAVRNLGTRSIQKFVNNTTLSADKLKTYLSYLKKLREAVPPMSDAYKTSRRNPQMYAEYARKNGFLCGYVLSCCQGKFDKYYKNNLDRLIETYDLPYSEKKKIVPEVMDDIEKQLNFCSKKTRKYQGMLMPCESIVRIFFSVLMENIKTIPISELESLQKFDGVIASLAIRAFEMEKHRKPASLTEVEEWLGYKLPDDIFADMAPLRYAPSGAKKLYSVGCDSQPDTADDLIFMPAQSYLSKSSYK